MLNQTEQNTHFICDLHCHSTASDGLLSPTEIVERAVQNKVQLLALTDHDTTQGIAEAKKAAQQHAIRLLTGVEISALWDNKTLHIVGLNFDENHPAMTALLNQQTEIRQQRAVQIGEKLTKIGGGDAYQGAKSFTTGEVTRAHYARYLVEIGKVPNEQYAFKHYLVQGKVGYVKANWCDIRTAIAVIQQAGGVAVLAHPLRYQLSKNQIKRMIESFKLLGGDGLEVASCGQTIEQRRHLCRLAMQHNLIASVGSDFHFPCGWRELGKSLYIPQEYQDILPTIW